METKKRDSCDLDQKDLDENVESKIEHFQLIDSDVVFVQNRSLIDKEFG